MQHVINTSTGVVYQATPLLLKTKQFRLLPPDAESLVQGEPPVRRFKVVPDSSELGFTLHPYREVTDEATGQVTVQHDAPEPELAEQPPIPPMQMLDQGDAKVMKVAEPVMQAQERNLSVPEDFDLSIDVRTMGKPQLIAIAARIDGLMFQNAMKVKELREIVQGALDELNGAAAEPAGAAPASPEPPSQQPVPPQPVEQTVPPPAPPEPPVAPEPPQAPTP